MLQKERESKREGKKKQERERARARDVVGPSLCLNRSTRGRL